jgi:hypothetical protein
VVPIFAVNCDELSYQPRHVVRRGASALQPDLLLVLQWVHRRD